jgi:hypothetical protein
VGRELRRRINKAFDARGIEIPQPHLSSRLSRVSRLLSGEEMTAQMPSSSAPGRPAS